MTTESSRRTVSRRDYLKTTAGALAAAGLGSRVASGQGAARSPNILVIMSDEHNANVLGCYGNSLARTPNVDALAARGVLFESAYTNSPLCVPSRLSFTSGKYCSRVSAWSNACSLPSPACMPRLARRSAKILTKPNSEAAPNWPRVMEPNRKPAKPRAQPDR
ncbi:MAG: sulfatase-like hydrolase/transferase [Candidatus Hydrogenedentes bacterium]|nr:sulfatase-like hydrolase/transferase [Candidatus Hydrogenedentota bacterium]